jgi:hypothetical protein
VATGATDTSRMVRKRQNSTESVSKDSHYQTRHSTRPNRSFSGLYPSPFSRMARQKRFSTAFKSSFVTDSLNLAMRQQQDVQQQTSAAPSSVYATSSSAPMLSASVQSSGNPLSISSCRVLPLVVAYFGDLGSSLRFGSQFGCRHLLYSL